MKLQNDNAVEDHNQKPAWVDEDDINFGANIIPNIKSKELYVDKLKQKYETLMGTPNWAKINNKTKDGKYTENDSILRRVGHMHKEKKAHSLKKDLLNIKKLAKINHMTGNEGPYINCIEFHPKSTVALVAGQAGIVSLFAVGGHTNDRIHSFKLSKCNILTAHFAPSGNEAYLSMHRNDKFCSYDLIKAEPTLVPFPNAIKMAKVFKLSPDGKYIAISDGFDEAFIMSAASRELIRILKHNTNISSMTFSHDSKQLYSFGRSGEVTIWDLSTYRSLYKFYDNGCVNASEITTSPCGRLLATGSKEGIVNIYETANLNSAEPFPLKTISNLTTKISTLKFNPTTEILAIASNACPNAAKMVHIPSYNVFMNFPKQSTTLGVVSVMSFSPNGGYLGIGNNKSHAAVYRLNYYKNY